MKGCLRQNETQNQEREHKNKLGRWARAVHTWKVHLADLEVTRFVWKIQNAFREKYDVPVSQNAE